MGSLAVPNGVLGGSPVRGMTEEELVQQYGEPPGLFRMPGDTRTRSISGTRSGQALCHMVSEVVLHPCEARTSGHRSRPLG